VLAQAASTRPTNSNPVGWVEQDDTHRSAVEHQRRFLVLVKAIANRSVGIGKKRLHPPY